MSLYLLFTDRRPLWTTDKAKGIGGLRAYWRQVWESLRLWRGVA